MTRKKPEEIKTNFEVDWLENVTYENTQKCIKSPIYNSMVEDHPLSITANKEIAEEIKIRIPRVAVSEETNSWQILCKWEGVVTRIGDNAFIGRLKDLTNENDVEHEAEFSVDDLQGGDEELLDAGAVFYWYIGYMETVGGTRTKSSLLRFQRLPGWQKNRVIEIERKAQQLRGKLKWT